MDMSSTSAPWNSAWNRIGSTDMATVRDNQNVGMFAYTHTPLKFEHPEKCRNALGLVGGSDVSNISGNLVDLESDLLGITRVQTKCTARQYKPQCALGGKDCPDMPGPLSFTDKMTGETHSINTSARHLPTCQMNTLPGVNIPDPLNVASCYPQRF